MVREQRQRVIAYVDGFNLYFGLREIAWRRYYWLNIRAMAMDLLKPHQELVFAKYFTTRIRGAHPHDPIDRQESAEASRRRQGIYLDALKTLEDFKIYRGHFLARSRTCRACEAVSWTHEEKMTDVQIATEMLTDAFERRFDVALLVSGDTDLVPPIRTIRRLFPEKRVVVAFPPRRASGGLKKAAHSWLSIGRKPLKDNQFPERLVKPDGFVLRRPEEWH